MLRACGRPAAYLEGGIAAFEAAGGITIERRGLPAERPAPGSRWAIDAAATIDRLAGSWLIRRFVDPQARFLTVAPDLIEEVAKEAGAVSCEAGREGSPQAADGSRFEALLRRFGIEDPALQRLAVIIRGAGEGRGDPAPESAGLRAIFLGLTAIHGAPRPGEERGLAVYDALFACLRGDAGRS